MYMKVTNTVLMLKESRNKISSYKISNFWCLYLSVSLCKGISVYIEHSSHVSSGGLLGSIHALSSIVLNAGTQCSLSVPREHME